MSSGIKFTVGGKDHSNNIKGGIYRMFEEATVKKIKADLGDTFHKMQSEGGSVVVDLENGKIRFENCSAGTIEQIKSKIH